LSETHKIQLLCELKRLESNTQDSIVMLQNIEEVPLFCGLIVDLGQTLKGTFRYKPLFKDA